MFQKKKRSIAYHYQLQLVKFKILLTMWTPDISKLTKKMLADYVSVNKKLSKQLEG